MRKKPHRLVEFKLYNKFVNIVGRWRWVELIMGRLPEVGRLVTMVEHESGWVKFKYATEGDPHVHVITDVLGWRWVKVTQPHMMVKGKIVPVILVTMDRLK